MSDRRDGIVLVLLSALLVLLVAVAAALAQASAVQRNMHRSGVAAARAGLLARGGVERARMELRRAADPAYGGEDYDGDGLQNPAPTSYEMKSQVYRPAAFDTEECPPLFALRPSFFAATRDSGVVGGGRAPGLTLVEGAHRGFSGRLRGAHADAPEARGDTYILRVRTQDGIHVNGGDPAAGAGTGYNATLRRILGTLAEALDREDGVDDGVPVDEADGHGLVDLRPAAGWPGWDAMRDTALGGSQGKRDALAPYLTLRPWIDRKVIAPNATAGMIGQAYESRAQIRLAHETYPSAPGTHEPTFERIPPAPGGRIVGRAPVSLAWARRRRPALIALMAGLRGVYLEESLAGAQSLPLPAVGAGVRANAVGEVRDARISLDWGAGTDDCRTAAGALAAHGGPLETWRQWEAFCDTIAFSGSPSEVQAKRDILKANFNPNGNLNKFSPNASAWKTVDKSDLLAYSTEFSLFPTSPMEVQSAGRVLDVEGRPLAIREILAATAAPSVLRLTAQSEFVCGNLGSLEEAGDEGAFRLPGASPYLSPSWGVDRTWGHRLPPVVAAGMANGLSLQTYPAAYADPDGPGGAPMTIAPAAYDGSVQLATIETASDDTYTVASAPADMKMLASYDDNLDLDLSDSAVADGALQHPDTQQASATAGLWDAPKPGTFYPDGAYSEWQRAPAYRDRGNSHGMHDTISFWAKPNYASGVTGAANVGGWRGRRLLRRTRYVAGSTDDGVSFDQHFSLSHYWRHRSLPRSRVTLQFEICGGTNADADLEHQFTVDAAEASHRWTLVTVYHDFQGATGHETGALGLGGLDPSLNELTEVSGYESETGENAFPLAQDISLPPAAPTGREDSAGEHLLVLGVRSQKGMVGLYLGGGADTTFDEFAIYDFGQNRGALQTLAPGRYAAGRYYRGSVYYDPSLSVPPDDGAPAYFSPPISLPAGSSIRQVRWSYRLPWELPTDYAQVELAREDGTGLLWPDGARASDSPSWTPGREWWEVNRAPGGTFRLRAVFLRTSSIGPGTPILDSPSLEELVVLYGPSGGTGIVAWSER